MEQQRVLRGIAPERVFSFFEDLCRIPHGSGNTKAISDYCADFARKRGLRYVQDESNNIVIFQGGTCGREDHPAVILQGHLDMVCAKEPDVDFNFSRDGLRLKVEDGCITAEGTSLGGDDGIAVAYALAVLDDPSIPHPPIEAVFTVDEEIGLLGAGALDCSILQGRRMLNLDSEEEGVLTVSCAGGLRCDLSLPLPVGHGCGALSTVVLSGFSGGHSGADIHLGRANAISLLGELLQELTSKYPLQIISLSGGAQDNAIPTESRASFLLPPELREPLRADVQQWWSTVKARFAGTDPSCVLDYREMGDVCAAAYSPQDSGRMAALIAAVPSGVLGMSQDIPGLVESSMNLGILALQGGFLCLGVSLRSGVDSEKARMCNQLAALAQSYGAKISSQGEYPAWEYRKESPLRDIMVETYTGLYGKPPAVEAIHAGLECGVFSGKLPGLDCVSFGPDLPDIHTTRERLPIDSAQRTWSYLLAVLARL